MVVGVGQIQENSEGSKSSGGEGTLRQQTFFPYMLLAKQKEKDIAEKNCRDMEEKSL